MLIRSKWATTSIELLQEVDVVFILCQHGSFCLLDILPLEVTKDPMGCCVATAWPFDCFCVESLCGPYTWEVNAGYQRIEELYVQLQVPVTLRHACLDLSVSCTWD